MSGDYIQKVRAKVRRTFLVPETVSSIFVQRVLRNAFSELRMATGSFLIP